MQGEDPDEVDTSRIATATITNILLFIMLQTLRAVGAHRA